MDITRFGGELVNDILSTTFRLPFNYDSMDVWTLINRKAINFHRYIIAEPLIARIVTL